MIVVDTNLLVRMVTADEPELAARVADFLRRQRAFFVPKSVLLELEWVLRSRRGYHLPRNKVSVAVEALLNLPGAHVEDEDAVRQACEWFARGLDFTDALHLASCGDNDMFVTLDARLQRAASSLGIKHVTGLPD